MKKIVIFYNGVVIYCNILMIEKIYPKMQDGYVFGAYCSTNEGIDMWVYSYTEDFNSVYKAEICGAANTLNNANNYIPY